MQFVLTKPCGLLCQLCCCVIEGAQGDGCTAVGSGQAQCPAVHFTPIKFCVLCSHRFVLPTFTGVCVHQNSPGPWLLLEGGRQSWTAPAVSVCTKHSTAAPGGGTFQKEGAAVTGSAEQAHRGVHTSGLDKHLALNSQNCLFSSLSAAD